MQDKMSAALGPPDAHKRAQKMRWIKRTRYHTKPSAYEVLYPPKHRMTNARQKARQTPLNVA